jgi:hypothetical protein
MQRRENFSGESTQPVDASHSTSDHARAKPVLWHSQCNRLERGRVTAPTFLALKQDVVRDRKGTKEPRLR